MTRTSARVLLAIVAMSWRWEWIAGITFIGLLLLTRRSREGEAIGLW